MRIRLRRVEPVLRRALRGPCRIPSGSKLLVAVSGGADSLALLAGLESVAREFAIELHVAHLHHGLRGPDADADRAFVRETCARLGVPLTDARWDTRRRMASRGWSGQDGLRRLRREFLARVARSSGAAVIATAHTADDQLETLLLRLGRGAGLRGLGGMRARYGRWIKPLLEATRADIEADLRRADLSWREDESNRSRDYARNRIRHDVVPALAVAVAAGEQVGANPAERRAALARRAAAATREVRAAEHALAAWARRGLSRASRIQGGVLQLDSRGVAPYPPAARRMAFRLLWKQLGASGEGLTNRHLDALERLVESGRPGAEVRLPGGWRAERSRDTVRFHPARRATAPVGQPPRWSDSRPQSRRTPES
jgi:tRNA(Ile)-lysidine synthase